MKQQPLAKTIALSSVLVLLLSGCGNKSSDKGANAKAAGNAPTETAANTVYPVDVATAKVQTVLRAVDVTGSLAALQSVSLTPKVNQRVVSVTGREGTRVRAGEVVVQQDTTDLNRQLQQAQANLASARANLASAEANVQATAAKVTQARTNLSLQTTTAKVGVEDAQQQLQSAQANLALTRRPQRSQEIAVAENSVKQAQANYDKAKADRERYEALFKEGAAAQITLDQYATQEKVAKASLDSAQEQLAIAQEGGRAEQIRAAETQVTRAQWQLRQAKANQQQVQVRQDDVRAAEAQFAQANAAVQQSRAAVAQQQAAVALAQQAVQDASIVSPIDGVISERKVEPGQIAAPGTTVMTVVALSDVYFEAQIPETQISYVHTGQSVPVTLDAYPGKTFPGKIAKVYPSGNLTSRIFTARVEIPNSEGQLRPGLFARGRVIAERRQGITVPVESVVTDPIGSLDADEAKAALANTRVYVVANGVAQERKVQQGLLTPDGKSVEVSGVQEGDQVVTTGQKSLKDGARVTVRPSASDQQQQAAVQTERPDNRS